MLGVRVAPAVQPLSKKISQSPPHLRPGEQSFSAGNLLPQRGRSVFWVYTEKMSGEILNLLQITHKKMTMGL